MSMTKTILLTLALIPTVIPAVQAQDYEFYQLPVPGPVVNVQDVNNAGLVAGWIFDPASFSATGFLSDLDEFTTYDYPGALITIFNGINESGEISGHFFDGAGSHGFLLDKKGGTMVVDFPGAILTAALGNNERGSVVGVYGDTAGVSHGFLRDKQGNYSTIDVPGAVFTEAVGINARGDIVGDYADGSGLHGFVRLESGEFITVDHPGSAGSFLSGITDSGDLAGGFTDPATGEQLGFFATKN